MNYNAKNDVSNVDIVGCDEEIDSCSNDERICESFRHIFERLLVGMLAAKSSNNFQVTVLMMAYRYFFSINCRD
jgi:hypothetical protein